MAALQCEYTNTELYTLNGQIVWLVNYISIKIFFKVNNSNQ